MSDEQLTPAQIAEYDQSLAKASEGIGTLAGHLRDLIRDNGEHMGLAEFLGILDHVSASSVRATLAVAMLRLVRAEDGYG